MKRVFISYSRKNQSFAERLARDLDDAGLDVWIDLRQIQAGEFWQREIFKGLQSAEFMVACISPDAINSEWVNREIQYAREQDKPIYPVMVERSLQYLRNSETLKWLTEVQFINFEDRYEQAFPELLEALPGGRPLGAFDSFDPASIPNPFKGLEAFQQTDAALFFGREELVRRAVQRIRETRFLGVVGASGSGKSSLVRAGIIPQIRSGAIPESDNWPIVIFTPGAHPIEAMARRLNPLLAEKVGASESLAMLMDSLRATRQMLQIIDLTLLDMSDDARLVLVIDQFEEVFTRTSETERTQFLEVIRIAATVVTSRAQFIITMRADFFGELSHYPDLANLFERDNLLIVTEMTTANLLRAIEGPAQAVGLRFEQGLVDRILDDVQTEPGSLPLLQAALNELFKRRQANRLMHEAYDAIGGVRQALARHAESIFTGLNATQQDMMRRILLRLVEVSESGEATRRRVPRSELDIQDTPEDMQEAVIEILTSPDARLIVANREITLRDEEPVTTLQVSHEALIREWDRFQTWVSASLDDLKYETELRKAADNWDTNNRDDAYLLRGKRLTRAEVWIEDNHQVTDLQRDFINASIAADVARRRAEEARMQRELALQQRAARRARFAITFLALLFLGAFLAGIALFSINDSLRQAENTAIEQQMLAQQNADRAQRLALSASALLALSDSDSDLALALAVEAATLETQIPGAANLPAFTQRTLADIGLDWGTRWRIPTNDIVTATATHPNGEIVAVGMINGFIALYNARTGETIASFNGHSTQVNDLIFYPNGLLASASNDAELNLRVWDVAAGSLVYELNAHQNGVNRIARLDERFLISGGNDTQLLIWDMNTGTLLFRSSPLNAVPNEHNMPITAVTTASGSGLIASADRSSRVIVRDVDNALVWEGRFDTGRNPAAVTALSFSTVSEQLLVGLSDGSLLLADTATGEARRRITTLENGVTAGAFIPNSASFIVASQDSRMSLWDSTSGQQIRAFDLDESIGSLAISADGRRVLTGVNNATLRLWDLQDSAELAKFETEVTSTIALNTDATLAASDTLGGAILLWDLTDDNAAPAQVTIRGNPIISALKFSPDDTRLAVGDFRNQSIHIIDVATGTESQRLSMESDTGFVQALAFSPDGLRLVSGSTDGSMILWDIASVDIAQRYEGHNGGITSLAFSQDGTRILSGSDDNSLILWDTTSGEDLIRLNGHDDDVRTVAINADGTQALSGGNDETLRLWDLTTGREIRRIEDHDRVVQNVTFLGDSNTILSGAADGTLRLWDLTTGNELRRFVIEGENGRPIIINEQVTSADGNFALTSLLDQTLRVWRIFPSNEELLQWINRNRFVPDLSCNERLRFGVDEPGNFADFGQQRFVRPDAAYVDLQTESTRSETQSVELEGDLPVRLLARTTVDGETVYRVCTADDREGWVQESDLSTSRAG